MSKKVLWILSSKHGLKFPYKQQKVEECISFAKKKNINYKQLFFEDCILDTASKNQATPQQGDSMIVFVSRAHFSKQKLLYVLQYYEARGVTLINSTQTIYTVSDKWLTNSMASAAGIPVPRTKLIETKEDFNAATFADFRFPVVAKTPDGSFGQGVFWCDTSQSLSDLIVFSAVQQPQISSMLVQEAIVASKGCDIRVIVLNGKILGAVKRINESHSFKANIKQGGVATFHEVDTKLQKYCDIASKVFKLGFAGLDFLVDDDGEYYLTEINSDPGFHGFQSVHTTINLAEKIINSL